MIYAQLAESLKYTILKTKQADILCSDNDGGIVLNIFVDLKAQRKHL